MRFGSHIIALTPSRCWRLCSERPRWSRLPCLCFMKETHGKTLIFKQKPTATYDIPHASDAFWANLHAWNFMVNATRFELVVRWEFCVFLCLEKTNQDITKLEPVQNWLLGLGPLWVELLFFCGISKSPTKKAWSETTANQLLVKPCKNTSFLGFSDKMDDIPISTSRNGIRWDGPCFFWTQKNSNGEMLRKETSHQVSGDL